MFCILRCFVLVTADLSHIIPFVTQFNMQFALWCYVSSRSSYLFLVAMHYRWWFLTFRLPLQYLCIQCVKVDFYICLTINNNINNIRGCGCLNVVFASIEQWSVVSAGVLSICNKPGLLPSNTFLNTKWYIYIFHITKYRVNYDWDISLAHFAI